MNSIMTQDVDGTIEYRNELDQLHRLDGPARTDRYGRTEWWKDGVRHREDGPATVDPQGLSFWYKDGRLHNETGPAVIYPDGYKAWYKNGSLHREDGPAVIKYLEGIEEFWIRGINTSTRRVYL